MNRNEVLSETRAMADATNSTRWSDPQILRLLDTAFKREWARILNANRYYRIGTRAVSPVNGRFAVSALDGGSGDSAERFYRIIGVHDGDNLFRGAELVDNLLTPTLGPQGSSLFRQFWRVGSEIEVHPPGGSLSIVVNHTPQLPTLLAGGSSTVVFPEGYESVLLLETAAYMLVKGGAETREASDLKVLAEEIRGEMLADLARITTDPQEFRHGDSRYDWAG